MSWTRPRIGFCILTCVLRSPLQIQRHRTLHVHVLNKFQSSTLPVVHFISRIRVFFILAVIIVVIFPWSDTKKPPPPLLFLCIAQKLYHRFLLLPILVRRVSGSIHLQSEAILLSIPGGRGGFQRSPFRIQVFGCWRSVFAGNTNGAFNRAVDMLNIVV